MLAADEFSVATLADAIPLSLILPRRKSEATFLVGQIEDRPAAVALSGDHKFRCFDCGAGSNWKGLLIPNIRVEVEELSVFDPGYFDAFPGTVVRTGT